MQKILNADKEDLYTVFRIQERSIYWHTFFDQKIKLLKLILDDKMNKIENAAKAWKSKNSSFLNFKWVFIYIWQYCIVVNQAIKTLRSNFDKDNENHDDDLMIKEESSEVDKIIKEFYCETTFYMRNLINDKKIKEKLNKIDEISDKIYCYVKENLKMKKWTVRLLKIQVYSI